MNVIIGDLIDLASDSQFDVIIHGCNCQNTMSKGFAKLVKEKFPEAYKADLATPKGDTSKLGTTSHAVISRFNSPLVVVNAYTQLDWKGRGVKVDYEAIRSSMMEVKKQFSGKRIGFPLIGAGLAGGDWVVISEIIEDVLAGENCTLVRIEPNHKPNIVISGGQTGADCGGLLAAERAGLPTGGWAPKGYKTEKGSQVDTLKNRFKLIEHESSSYPPRTNDNVRDSDATIIFATNTNSRGTEQTINFCVRHDKKHLLLNPSDSSAVNRVIEFLNKEKPEILNIAGNRESRSKGISASVAKIMYRVFI